MAQPTKEQFTQEIINALMGLCVGALIRERNDGDVWMWLRSKEAQVRTIADNLYDRMNPPKPMTTHPPTQGRKP